MFILIVVFCIEIVNLKIKTPSHTLRFVLFKIQPLLLRGPRMQISSAEQQWYPGTNIVAHVQQMWKNQTVRSGTRLFDARQTESLVVQNRPILRHRNASLFHGKIPDAIGENWGKFGEGGFKLPNKNCVLRFNALAAHNRRTLCFITLQVNK